MDFIDNNNENNKELMQIFQTESEEITERIFNNLYALEKTPANKEIIANVYRDLHSLKGAVRMIGYNNIQMIIHKMEDIFDAVNNSKLKLEQRFITLITKSLESVSRYVQESIMNNREVIDEDYKSIISNLEYVMDIEFQEDKNPKHTGGGIPGLDIPGLDIPGIDISEFNIPSFEDAKNGIIPEVKVQIRDLSAHQEEINLSFNSCFEIIDSIVPEEESQDIVLLKQELCAVGEKMHQLGCSL